MRLVFEQGSFLVVSRQASRSVEDGEISVRVLEDLDAGLDEVSPVALFGDLQDASLVSDGVVVLDLALLLDGEDVAQRPADIVEEGRALFGGGDGELSSECGQEGPGDMAVGLFDGGDAGQAQLLGETPLQGGEEALDASPGLGRVGRNVLDAELAERPSDLRGSCPQTWCKSGGSAPVFAG